MQNNLLIHADNLTCLNHLLNNNLRGKIDLVYIDQSELAIEVTKKKIGEIENNLFMQKNKYELFKFEQKVFLQEQIII